MTATEFDRAFATLQIGLTPPPVEICHTPPSRFGNGRTKIS